MTKNKIVLISLAVALVALVIVYFLVVAPLLNDELEPPVPQDGEGIYNNRLTVYTPIETDNILSIHIKNDKSEHEFVRQRNDKNEVKTVIKGYENLSFDESIYTYLLSFAASPLSADNEPYRNLTDEQMREYGVTADTCQSTMTVYYKDANGQEQKHVLRIGFSTFTASPTYYVALDGRNSVYRFSGAVEGAVLYSICDYIQPVIYVGYQNSSVAMIDITSFSITKGYINDPTSLKPIIFLTGKPSVSSIDGTESTSYTAHVMDANGNIIKSTAADSDYVINAIDLFYTSFLGDVVVAIDPDKATLDKYGLGDDDFRYIINARDKKGDEVHTFFISAPITDAETEEVYYYTLASQAGVPLLIRVPEQAFIPQNQFKDMESTVFDEDSVLNWAATNTVGAGLAEGIKPDEQYSGVKSVTVKAPIGTWKDGKLQNDGGMFQDTYYTNYVHDATKNLDILMITSQNGSYKDERVATGKEFNKFYYMLIAHPIPSRFNNMTETEIAEKATEDNLLFTLYVELNDGRVQLLEYYQISSEYVMMRNTMGETVNGSIVMGETKTIFDTTRGQVIDYLQDSLIKLVTGVKIDA